jgi:hypothetical protein
MGLGGMGGGDGETGFVTGGGLGICGVFLLLK